MTASALPRWLAARFPQGIRRWLRYTSASITAGICSTGTLLLLYGLQLAGPRAATVIAFFAGAIPNYVLSRTWTWRGRGRSQPVREIVPYAAIVAVTTVTAALLTGLADEHVGAVTSLHWLQVAIVGAVFVGTYATMFVIKFLLLDRFVFPSR